MLNIHKRHRNEEYTHSTVSSFRCDKLCPKVTIFSFKTGARRKEMGGEKKRKVVDYTIFNVVWLHYQTHKWPLVTICLYSPMCCYINSKWCTIVLWERKTDPIWKQMKKDALGDLEINKLLQSAFISYIILQTLYYCSCYKPRKS